jgi:hypothetical protein
MGNTSYVVSNETLPFELARRILAGKPPAKEAKTLFKRLWTPEELDVLVPMEKRKSILAVAAETNPLGVRALEYILGHKEIEGALADAVLAHQQLETSTRMRFAKHASTAARVQALSYFATDESGLDALRDVFVRQGEIFTLRRNPGLSRALADAAEEHPEILDVLDSGAYLHVRSRLALSTSLQLTDAASQRTAGDVGGKSGYRDANETLVLRHLASHPYLDRTVADEIVAELAHRPVAVGRYDDVQSVLTRRCDGDVFLAPGTSIRDAPVEILEWLLADMRNAVPVMRSQSLLFEVCHHPELTDQSVELLLARIDRGGGHDLARAELQRRFPEAFVRFDRLRAVRTPPAQARHEWLLKSRAELLSRAAETLQTKRSSLMETFHSRYDFAALTLAASMRFGADETKWDAFFLLLESATGTLEQLLEDSEKL